MGFIMDPLSWALFLLLKQRLSCPLVLGRGWDVDGGLNSSCGPEPMDRTNDVSAAGTTPKKADPQQIPTGRPPTFPVHPLPQCSIPAPSPPYQAQQPMGGWGVRGARSQGRRGGTGNIQATHTNKIKRLHNLHYCFTCVYDVGHPVKAFPVAYTAYHMPNIPQDKAHMYTNQREIMVFVCDT